jgi:predicted  nucleic acid-binding Zn-ribbon protein
MSLPTAAPPPDSPSRAPADHHTASAIDRSFTSLAYDAPDTAQHTTKNNARDVSTTHDAHLSSDSILDNSLTSPQPVANLDQSRLDSDGSVLFDPHVKKHLMDIESSFIPEASPRANPSAPAPGADDTYLFGGSPGRPTNIQKTPAIAEERSSETGLPTTARQETVLMEQGSFEESEVGPEDSTDISHVQSSPAAAAKQRNINRVVTTAPKESFEDSHTSGIEQSLEKIESPPQMPVLNLDNGIENALHANMKSPPQNTRVSKRPSFLQNRQASQRSSISSIAARSDISGGTDITLGADFALQSGGALPANASTNGHSTLSRLPSLGSIASLTSSQSETAPIFGRTRSSTSGTGIGLDSALTRLDEEHPITPRGGSMMAPSDTVIAQHIRNIHVPETIAREYRAKHSTTRSPERRQAIGLSYSTRSKHNLTLKEQNSKIDKLSKENFDLKLKIHFLDQALQNRSDEGVKEMISKNVQLQTDLANEKKENMSLRRKIRELEKKVKAQEEEPKERNEDADDDSLSEGEEKAEMEEEIIYLKETMQNMHAEMDRLKEENMNKEVEKRRLAEYVRSMGERRTSEPSSAVEETIEMWKDLLQAETARREAADEDAANLREDIRKIKLEHNTALSNNSVRNVYNVSKRQSTAYGARSEAGFSEAPSDLNGGGVDSRASTAVDQLKHENAELRRDLSAQTSMLTSRNRERERLQQEIEDLKIHHRRGGLMDVRSVAGDSIFDRSVSRAHQRSTSRASGVTRAETHISDEQAEQLERKMGTLRDELAQVKMLNQDLEKALNEQIDHLESLERDNLQLKEEGTMAVEDLRLLQSERDELLLSIQEKDTDFETLRGQAVESIEELEAELEQRKGDFEALQAELKTVSESAVNLEDELNASRKNEEGLQQQLEEAEREMENLDQKIRDTTSKNERLDVQLENSQNEIAFLREEQEGDKIKIGELEASLAAAETRIEDMIAQSMEERRQRDAINSQEKAEVEKMFDEVNSDRAKLRRKLADKEKEADTWKERLETLESNLREALGDLNGTRSSLLKVRGFNHYKHLAILTKHLQDVTKLQRDLEHTLSALEIARQDLSEKDRLLRTRDALLESSGLETKRLTEALDKERQARRADRSAWELMQRNQQSLTRTIQQNDSRVSEVETARQADRRRFAQLEHTLKDQLAERNSLLSSLWNRLTTICGAEFVQRHGLGDISPSGDNLAKNWSQFARSISLAAKTVETMLGSFKTQIKNLDKTLSKEFQNLERALEIRSKRIDHLETMVRTSRQHAAAESIDVRSTSRASSRSAREDQYARVKSENKILKAEVQMFRNAQTPSQVPDRGSSTRGRRESSLMRHYSTSMVESPHLQSSPARMHSPVAVDPTVTVPAAHPTSHIPIPVRTDLESPTNNRRVSHHVAGTTIHTREPPSSSGGSLQPSEQRWVHRLKELERRLKSEREARLLDRSGARKRIEESEAEQERLRQKLEKEIERIHNLEEDRLLDDHPDELDV